MIRSNRLTPCWLAVFATLGVGCLADAQDVVEVPLWVAGTTSDAPLRARGQATVLLDQAKLAFGPLYLCAGTTAGELCDTARAEWTDSVVVDALDPEDRRAGELIGVSGQVRSFMYDLGITSLLTEEDPVALDAATSLGNASVKLSGTAFVGEVAIPFATAIAIQQDDGTEQGIPVVRSSVASRIDHALDDDEPGLLVRFDPQYWVSDIDFEALLEDVECAADGRPLVCGGMVEKTCAEDGEQTQSRDCTALGQVCVIDQGCVGVLDFADDSQARRSIRAQVSSGPAPALTWGHAPSDPR